MDIEFENRIWKAAAQHLGLGLQALVEEGIDSFQRPPGLDSPTRIHESDIGHQALTSLRDALAARHQLRADSSNLRYVEIRSRRRRHLARHLQWHLIQTGLVGEADWEDYLASDLGL